MSNARLSLAPVFAGCGVSVVSICVVVLACSLVDGCAPVSPVPEGLSHSAFVVSFVFTVDIIDSSILNR